MPTIDKADFSASLNFASGRLRISGFATGELIGAHGIVRHAGFRADVCIRNPPPAKQYQINRMPVSFNQTYDQAQGRTNLAIELQVYLNMPGQCPDPPDPILKDRFDGDGELTITISNDPDQTGTQIENYPLENLVMSVTLA